MFLVKTGWVPGDTRKAEMDQAAKKPGVFFSMQCAVLLGHASSRVYSCPAAPINMNMLAYLYCVV